MSKALELAPMTTEEEPQPYELRRLRIERWRIVYAVTEETKTIDILTVQKRPPYDYGDLKELLEEAR
jgi:ParE toxin of type II toxin-antitoxin system, parDE